MEKWTLKMDIQVFFILYIFVYISLCVCICSIYAHSLHKIDTFEILLSVYNETIGPERFAYKLQLL